MAEDILSIADFIKQTIIQVTDGLHDAQEKVRDKGTQIFPSSYGDAAETTDIDFDLAVTRTSKDGNTKLGVALGVVNLGAGSGEAGTEIISRVKFSVKVGFVIFNPPSSKRPQTHIERHTKMNMEDF